MTRFIHMKTIAASYTDSSSFVWLTSRLLLHHLKQQSSMATGSVVGGATLYHSNHHYYSSTATHKITPSSSSLFLKNQQFKSTTKCFYNNNQSSPLIKTTQKRFLFTCRSQILTKEDGEPESLDYRVFFHDDSGKKVSPWHDIPLQSGDGVFNFIVEIPKETSAKMEVATDEPYTPIKQDTKKGKLRYYPYNINWNYGLLPQTWEDPSFANPEVDGSFGDNDPVDVVEIGESQGKIGQILKVKPLGVLAMIDEGELDWKVIAISVDDPKAALVNDVDDVEIHFPGTLTAIRDWFRDYKIPDGKPANKFGLGNKAANKEYALKVITETNESWAKLMRRTIPAGELSLA